MPDIPQPDTSASGTTPADYSQAGGLLGGTAANFQSAADAATAAPANTAPVVGPPAPGQAPPSVADQQAQAQRQASLPENKPKGSIMADILRAVSEVLGGPSTVDRVDPATGNIVPQKLSRAERIANTAGIYMRGAAAGAAQQGPGAAGKAALAGVQGQQQFQQQQQENVLAESKNVSQTLLNQASLQMMSKQQAKFGLEMKAFQMDLDKNQADIANSLQNVLNMPGVKVLQHFDSNDDINAHLEAVGPRVAKQYAVDLTANNIRLFQSPGGGFDAVEVPKKLGETAIGPGLMVHRTVFDPKTDVMTLQAVPADPNVTWDNYQLYEGAALATYNSSKQVAQQFQEGYTRIALQKEQAAEAHQKAELTKRQAQNLASGNAKDENGNWNPASLPVALVEGTMDPTQLSKRSQDYNQKLQSANQYSLERYGKPFDIAAAQSDYKYSTNSTNQNTLKMIAGMTEKGGAIDIAKGAATALPQLPEATLNKVFNLAATEFGSKEATNFHTAMLGLADEYSKVMGGGVSSDTGRQQALDILKASYSKGQIDGAISIMQRDLTARKAALVGSNRYLIKQYGASVPPPAGKPAGATMKVPGTDGKLYWSDGKQNLGAVTP
jgi:hypothetical protein